MSKTSWAAPHIKKLRRGETVQFRPFGGSMRGKVPPGSLVTVEPCDPQSLKKGDVVLCTVKGHDYLHLVKAVGPQRFLIGNNVGGTNGWIGPSAIHGRCIDVEP